jgi:hypothetical protein
MGTEEDLPLLLQSSKNAEKLTEGKSPFLRLSSINAVSDLLEREPGALNHETKNGVSSLILDSMNSESRGVRQSSASLLMKLSDNQTLTGSFPKQLKDLPRNENTAEALGYFAGNLQSGNPDRVTFTSLILDKAMKGATEDFKSDLLKVATGNLAKYHNGNNADATRDTTAVLGRHFSSLLPDNEKQSFGKMTSGEKLDKMIKHFHS